MKFKTGVKRFDRLLGCLRAVSSEVPADAAGWPRDEALFSAYGDRMQVELALTAHDNGGVVLSLSAPAEVVDPGFARGSLSVAKAAVAGLLVGDVTVSCDADEISEDLWRLKFESGNASSSCPGVVMVDGWNPYVTVDRVGERDGEVGFRGSAGGVAVRLLSDELGEGLAFEPVCSVGIRGVASVNCQVAFAALEEWTRERAISNIKMEVAEGAECGRFVAGDGIRLAMLDVRLVGPAARDAEILVPPVAFAAVGALMHVVPDCAAVGIELSVDGSRVAFRVGDYVLVSDVGSGRFPDYMKVVPAGLPNVATVNPAHLLEALQGTFVGGDTVSLKMESQPGPLSRIVLSSGDEYGSWYTRKIFCGVKREDERDGEFASVKVNGRYLLECLRGLMSDGTVRFEVGEPNEQVALRTWNGDYTYVLMPIGR